VPGSSKEAALLSFAKQLHTSRVDEGHTMNAYDEYRSSIPLYLDNELSGDELDNFCTHLARCAACKTSLEEEQALSDLLRRSRPLYPAPKAVREHTLGIVHSNQYGTIFAPKRLRRRLLHILSRPFRSDAHPALYWKLSTAAVLLLVLALVGIPTFVQRAHATTFVDTAAATHRSYLDGKLPLEIQTSSPAVVTAWFANKVGFHFQLPASQEVQGREQPYRLMGARLVNYQGTYAVLTTYEMQGKKISLLVASGKFATVAGGEEVRSGDLTFHYYGVGGFKVITWSNHGLSYALVSSYSGSAQQSCLVCHQNMADHENFAQRP
jgi:anti-sigma factor RsiW